MITTWTNATNSNQFINKAKELVCRYFIEHPEPMEQKSLIPDDFYVVWFSKTLQNWKALVSTDVFHGIYVEVTYSGTKQQTYLDIYRKEHNECINDAAVMRG